MCDKVGIKVPLGRHSLLENEIVVFVLKRTYNIYIYNICSKIKLQLI